MQQTVLSPHVYAQQNFRIFWVGISFRGTVDYILWIATGLQRRQSIEYNFKSLSWVLLYRDTIDRLLFYIKMTVIMS